jgi:hypothetical protein
MLSHINNFLDRHVLPWPVRFLTFRFVILATIALLIPLILFADNTVLVLGLNSYLNTMSVAVGSIVLLYAMIAEVRQKQIAELQEQRAQEDHQHVTEMHALVLEALNAQHEELHELQRVLATLQGKPYEAEKIEDVPDLHALHPQGEDRFKPGVAASGLADQLHASPLTDTIRRDLTNA